MKPKDKHRRCKTVYKVTDDYIHGFFEDHRFLSNFHLCSIWFEGREYASTENAYQAAKFPDALRGDLQFIDPTEAKMLGRKLKLTQIQIDKWDSRKVSIMSELQMIKYLNPQLRRELLATGTKYLEETNYWDDSFWGVYGGIGSNNLGVILMAVRKAWIDIEKGCK